MPTNRTQGFELKISPTQATRAGRMLAAGRLTATVRSKATGHHVTVTANCMLKDKKWEHVPFEQASHVFIKMGNGAYGQPTVATYYPAKQTIYFNSDDPAWIYAAKQTLWAASSGVQVTEKHEILEEGRCGKCGRPLTDPISIERGIGPECYGQMTGSHHSTKADREVAPPLSVTHPLDPNYVCTDPVLNAIFDGKHGTVENPAPGSFLAEVVADAKEAKEAKTDSKGRKLPKTFAELAQQAKQARS